ncbi:MAG: beta-lactamase family protein [Proteobacteria bacterium]|nr:beta-lactamase family protein [Pseudomonadota bacterium]
MQSRSLATLIGLLALTWCSAAGAQVWSSDKSAIADFYGTLAVTAKPGVPAPTPSIAMAVSINGTIVFSKGYGNVGPGLPVATGNTVYRIGSLSKQILAGALLGLIEDTSGAVGPGGKSPPGAAIALDDPITKFIPDWGMTATGPVTLRDMLNMHSGYASYTAPPANVPDPFDVTKPVKPRELLRYVLSMLFSNKSPGGANSPYVYSNTNYLLLANVIEFYKMKSMPGAPQYNYQTWLRSRIFNKAGMTNTGFLGDTFANALVAPPPYNLSNSAFSTPSWPMGAGEIMSSANDLLKWHAALMKGTLVSAQARQTLFTPVGSANYAMGWVVNSGGGFNWYNHGGDIPGYVSFDGIFQNAATGAWVSVVLLANNDNVPGLSNVGVCLAQLAMDPSTTKAGLSAFAKKACGIP